jgi:hypothetical protein
MKTGCREMDKIALRHFGKLPFFDPKPYLIQLRQIEIDMIGWEIADKVRTLRTNPLNYDRQLREAALFCYFIGQRIGTTVFLAKDEAQDYDFVSAWMDGSTYNYAPVQLKEVVPNRTNQTANLADVLASLEKKYVTSKELVVAIHLNQAGHLVPGDVVVPALSIGELWMFAGISHDQSQWALWGDFLRSPVGTRHEYPSP